MHKYAGMLGSEILLLKKASIRHAPLPKGSLSWSEIEGMMWEQIDDEARANTSGFKTIRKLLTDRRFDR
jgi:hypothetical protein